MLKHGIIFHSFTECLYELKKAEGVYIWTTAGEKLLDFTSGWNVSNLGWNNPEITQAIIDQAKINTYSTLESADPIQIKLAADLTKQLPAGLNVFGKATGGTEAVEEAMKTARAYTKRKKIIGFKDHYHGQSFGTMSLGWSQEAVQFISPMLPDVIQLAYPGTYRTERSEKELLLDFEKNLEKVLMQEDVAGVVTESGIITGWGTTYLAPKGYLSLLSRLTKKYNTLLILDEVGTGFSRTGKLFGMYHEQVTPDIATFAKGMSNGGGAIGAMVTTQKIAEATLDSTNLTSTFGWHSLSTAAAVKTLEIHVRDKVWERTAEDGEYMRKTLREELKNVEAVGDIRGLGLEIGVDFVKNQKTKEKNTEMLKKVIATSRENGLLLMSDQESNLQLMPPLIMERKDLDKGIEILVSAIKSV